MSSLECSVGKMFCVGFHTTVLNDDLVALLKRGVANVILFGRNCQSPEQVKALCADIKDAAGHPVLISVDQEGGRVQRLKAPFTELPSMRAVGQANDENLAKEAGKILARELRAVNIDIDFAPVLDVDTNPDNPVIASRSLGSDPEIVARFGCAILDGLQSEGVAACGKHFLGHGDTSQDSHHTLPRIGHSIERLNQVELPPFEAAIRVGVSSIMTAHVIFDAIDPDFPVTMSSKALDGVLRERFGFKGVVFSDDMEMKAIAAHFGMEEALMHGANAGIDVFPMSHTLKVQNEAIDLLIKLVERGKVPKARIEQANQRLDEMARKFYKSADRGPMSHVIGAREHHVVVHQIRRLCDESAFAGGKDPTDFM